MYSYNYNMPDYQNNMRCSNLNNNGYYYGNNCSNNYGNGYGNRFFPGGFVLPFAAGLLAGPLVFRPRPYYPYPAPYPVPYPNYY